MLLEDIYSQFHHINSVVNFLLWLKANFFLLVNFQSLGQTTSLIKEMEFDFNLMIKTVAQECYNYWTCKSVKLECRDVSISLRKLHKSFATLYHKD